MSEAVAAYAVAIAAATRASPQLEVGASPRGSLALMKLARANAALDGRDYVKPDDVKRVAAPHWPTGSPSRRSSWVQRVDPEEIVRSVVASVPAPVADEQAAVRLDRRAPVYAALAAAGLLVGLAGSLPSATALGAAFLVPLAYGLAARRPVLPRTRVDASSLRVLEGDERRGEGRRHGVRSTRLARASSCRCRRASGGSTAAAAGSFASHRARSARSGSQIACARWGAYALSPELTGRHAVGLVVGADSASGQVIRVYPRVERLRRVVAPLATRPASGNRAARQPGEGIEFAETREFRAGDRVRRINWRASARRGRLLVADRLPERSSDVVCFLDALAQAQTEEASTLDFSVRAAAALVSAYLPRRDRVGLLAFGAELQWVLPSGGARQQYRIVDAVLASESSRFYRWRDPRLIPRRVLPPQSLVVALTPLLDWRVIRALLDLRGRGFDLAVIEVSPIGFTEPGESESDKLAHRLWVLRRSEIRARYERLGVAVASWSDDAPLDAVLEGVRAFRRHAQIARV